MPNLPGVFGHDSTLAQLLEVVALGYFAVISVWLTVLDLRSSRLPNAIVLPAYGVGLVLLGSAGVIVEDWSSVVRMAVGAASLFGLYLALAVLSPGAMGFGDVKLAGVIGLFLAYLGWSELTVGAIAAFILGGVFAGVLRIRGRASRSSAIPFGPWMLVGAWVGIFWGASISRGYLVLIGIL